MAKKGPLGKAEKFYVEKNWMTSDYKAIAKFLDRTEDSIKDCIEAIKIMKTKAGGKFARQGDPENGGAVVATEAATMRGDDFRKSNTSTKRKESCTVKAKRE
jgi:hypothetical protein